MKYRIDGKVYEADSPEEAYKLHEAEKAGPQTLTASGAPVAEPSGLDAMMNFMAHSGLGTTAGFLPKIMGVLGAAGQQEAGNALGEPMGADAVMGAYKDTRDTYTDALDRARAQNPKLALAGNLVGGLATPVPGAGYVKAAASPGAMVLRSMGVGSGIGALQGLGYSREEGLGGKLEDAAIGAGIGLAAPPAIAGAGAIASVPVRSLIRALTENPNGAAARIIRSKAAEMGLTVDQIMAKLTAMGPHAVLADIDEAFTELATGAAGKFPGARKVARETLEARQAGAPARITGMLEGAMPPGQPTARDIAKGIAQGKRTFGPAYRDLQNQSIPVTGDVANLMQTPPVKAAYTHELGNWQARNIAPGVDPAYPPIGTGMLMGDISQGMKKTADRTISTLGTPGANASDIGAAMATRNALTAAMDTIPGMKAAREGYGATVMQPRAGLELGRDLWRATDSQFPALLAQIKGKTPIERQAMRAQMLASAQRAVMTAPGAKGSQFYGGPLMRTGALADDKLAIMTGSKLAAQKIDSQLANEAQFHDTMTQVLPKYGSPTAARLEAGTNTANAMRAGAGVATGKLSEVARTVASVLSGPNPWVAKAMMKKLMQQGMSRADVEALMRGEVTRHTGDILKDLSAQIQQAGAGATSGANAYLAGP